MLATPIHDAMIPLVTSADDGEAELAAYVIERGWTDTPRDRVTAFLAVPPHALGPGSGKTAFFEAILVDYLLTHHYAKTFSPNPPAELTADQGWLLAKQLSVAGDFPEVEVEEELLVEPPSAAIWEGLPESRASD
jgi:hypothetical protein